jgi:signal transduction histidine kinase
MNIQDILDLKGSEVITVLPTATIRDITVILADRGIGTVMVTDSSGNLVGIVSERDIVRCIAEQGEISFALHAGDLMSTDLITCTPETKVTDALAPMSRHGIRHLPVIVDGARESEISLSVALPPDLPVLVADSRMFKQMISNLLTNAVKFTPRGGAVYVTGRHTAETGIDIAVRDSGRGISADMLDKVTRPFHQADASLSRKHEGTGLGLALVNSMMLLHGGKLVLESGLGAGTTATLRFPAERMAGNHHGLPAEAADMPPLQAEIRAA